MKRFSFYGLAFFFVLLYTHGVWLRVGVPELIIKGLLFALPLAILLRQRGILHQPPPGFWFIWFYLGWSLSACIYNDEGVLRGLLYARYLIASYFVFWAAWNSRFTHGQLLWINRVIFTMFFVQIAAALFYWLVLDQRFEFVVGTMGYGTGGIATTFPTFAFGCLLAFFLYYNRLLFLVASFSFFLVGFASGKLGIYYLIPPILAVGMVLYAVAEGWPSAIRRGSVIVLIGLCTLPFLMFLLSRTQRAETDALQGEVGLYNKIAAFWHYNAPRQVALESRSWYTTTRTGTSWRILEETLRRGPLVFLFGRGPRLCLSESTQSGEAVSRYGIVYGIVGWSADALAIGWPAVFAHVGFYSYLLYLVRKTRKGGALVTYWKAIRLMAYLGFCVFLLSYLLYGTHFTTGGWLSSVYLYLLAVLLAPQYQRLLGPSPIVSSPATPRAISSADWREGPHPASWPRPSWS